MTDIPCQDMEEEINRLTRTIDNAVDMLNVLTPQYLQCVAENYTFPFPPMQPPLQPMTMSQEPTTDSPEKRFIDNVGRHMERDMEAIRHNCSDYKARMIDLRILEQHKGKQ